MAKFVLKNAYLSINSVDLSNYVKSITLNYSAELMDNTCMGDTSKAKLLGFTDWSLDVTFAQDYATSKVDATLFGLVGGAAVNIEVRPDTAVASATNPKFTGAAFVTSYNPISGSAGQVAETSVKLEGSGALSRATS